VSYQPIEVRTDGGLGELCLNRPAERNAMSPEMGAEIAQAVDELNGREGGTAPRPSIRREGGQDSRRLQTPQAVPVVVEQAGGADRHGGTAGQTGGGHGAGVAPALELVGRLAAELPEGARVAPQLVERRVPLGRPPPQTQAG